MFKFEIKGIKCDNVKCDYSDKEVKSSDYAKYLNKPCPKCGENLLTEKDYKVVQKMEAISNFFLIRWINKISDWFGGDQTRVFLDMDGSGKVSTRNKKK